MSNLKFSSGREGFRHLCFIFHSAMSPYNLFYCVLIMATLPPLILADICQEGEYCSGEWGGWFGGFWRSTRGFPNLPFL